MLQITGDEILIGIVLTSGDLVEAVDKFYGIYPLVTNSHGRLPLVTGLGIEHFHC